MTQHRGELIDSPLAEVVTATDHPWSILRAPDDPARAEALEGFGADLSWLIATLNENS